MIGGASVTDEWKTKSRELKVESGEEEEKGEEEEEEEGGGEEEEEEEEEVKVEEEKANKQRSYFVRVGERAIWTIDLPLDWANQASMKDHVQPPTPDSFLQLSSLPPLPPSPPPPSPASRWLPCSKRYGSFYIRNVLPPFLPSPHRVARFLDPFSGILEGDSRKYLTLPEIPGRRGSHSAKFSGKEK
ncbi:hypothetical protein HZH68_012744 [Vespula germanica]|uniref:Uncharacterized protein n=1 Tax=Vespula germanica TaxID=30212 RepID=A0A834JFV2_VESGE|nr:hypothetical protein HZH68_012744 [Vespula germanica]